MNSTKNIFEVPTPFNVKIEYEIAGLGDRMLAQIIDWFIQWCYVWFLIINVRLEATYGFLIPYLAFVVYCPITEYFFNGQTFGKMLMRIKVIERSGNSVSLPSILIRWLFSSVDVYLFGIVGIIFVVNSKFGQRVGDLAADTVVIKLNKNNSISPIFKELSSDYVVRYPTAILLKDKDIHIINQMLQQKMKYYDDDFFNKKIIKLKSKISQVIGVQSNDPPMVFIHKVLEDYSYLTSREEQD